MSELVILAASAGGVLLMIAVAAALGFRQRARLDADSLVQLAAAEHARVEASVVDASGRAAVARLSDGKWLIARVMADGVGVRVLAPDAVRVRATPNGLKLMFADLGFPALHLKVAGAAPAWLTERAA